MFKKVVSQNVRSSIFEDCCTFKYLKVTQLLFFVCVQRQMSVIQIEHGETTERGKPKPGGLSDPRLGTIDRKLKCETCTANMAECPGHFGHLELAKPMFHIGFIKTVLSIMRCVCFNCSKILADEVLWLCLCTYSTGCSRILIF